MNIIKITILMLLFNTNSIITQKTYLQVPKSSHQSTLKSGLYLNTIVTQAKNYNICQPVQRESILKPSESLSPVSKDAICSTLNQNLKILKNLTLNSLYPEEQLNNLNQLHHFYCPEDIHFQNILNNCLDYAARDILSIMYTEDGSLIGISTQEQQTEVARITTSLMKQLYPTEWHNFLQKQVDNNIPGYKEVLKKINSFWKYESIDTEWDTRLYSNIITSKIKNNQFNNDVKEVSLLCKQNKWHEAKLIIAKYDKKIQDFNFRNTFRRFQFTILKAKKRILQSKFNQLKKEFTTKTKSNTSPNNNPKPQNAQKKLDNTSNTSLKSEETVTNQPVTTLQSEQSTIESIQQQLALTPENQETTLTNHTEHSVQLGNKEVIITTRGNQFFEHNDIDTNIFEMPGWSDAQLQNFEELIEIANDVGARAMSLQDSTGQQINELGQDAYITAMELNQQNQTSIASSLCTLSKELFNSAISIGSKSIERVSQIVSDPKTYIKDMIQGYAALGKGLYNLTLGNATRTTNEQSAYYKSLTKQIGQIIKHVQNMSRSDWEQLTANILIDGFLQGNITKAVSRAASVAANSKIVLQGAKIAQRCYTYGTKRFAKALRQATLINNSKNNINALQKILDAAGNVLLQHLKAYNFEFLKK